ncbi:fucolectin-like [Haliotis asinina]|uniref:fucolectin-like n=1 Tax=Haliotis asinina TaxID=109174 RepID=UPI0035324946
MNHELFQRPAQFAKTQKKLLSRKVFSGSFRSPAADTGRNLALRKPAKASSTYTASHQIWASNVVDGSTSGNFNDLTCHSVENGDRNPWWQVDLQAVYRITRVQIVGRTDCCASEWLRDFSIEMYVKDPGVSLTRPWLCHYYKGVFKPSTQDIKCDSVVAGRFVKLSRSNVRDPEKTFQLCEVSVFGADTFAYFHKTNLSLTDAIVMTLPLGILHCSVICTTNPLCMAVKVVSDETPVCQLVYRSAHRVKGTTLTLSNFFVLTFSQLDV